jgi:hypothetical protein
MKLIAEDVNPIGMSYWRNIHLHSGFTYLRIILSRGGNLIMLMINKSDMKLITEIPLNINHTGEGCFFSAIDPNKLFIPFDNALKTLDISTGELKDVWISQNKLWQMHSSFNEDVFSATIKDANYNPIAWGVQRNGIEKSYPFKGNPDECQVDKSGKWLLIKEDNDNRIINLLTDEEYVIKNERGALGHSDCGYECAMGENDYSSNAGALDMIEFPTKKQCPIFSTGIWNMGYVSFTNARPGSLESQFCLVTTPSHLVQVYFNGSFQEVCPNLTESQEYNHRPKANLCPLGKYAVWTAFVSGQLNAYLVQL